jgi:hypothetical protein
MTEEDKFSEILKSAMHQVLAERATLDGDIHKAHHEYIQRKLDNDRKWDARFEKASSSFIGGMALAFLGGLGWIGKLVLQAITEK